MIDSAAHPGAPPLGHPTPLPVRNNSWAMFAMLVAMFGYSTNDAFVKSASDGLPLGQIVFLRGMFATLIVASIGMVRGGMTLPSPLWHRMFVLRSIGEVGATFCFLSALFALPIGSVTAVLQMLPLTITAAAAIFLREHVGLRRWMAAAAGMLGVALIIRPGSEMFQPAALFVLAAVGFMTLRDIATSQIPTHFPSITLTVLNTLLVTITGLVLWPFEAWIVPNLLQLSQLFGAAVFLALGFYFLIEATRLGDVSVVSPFRYSIIIWAVAFGYFIWGDVPDALALCGIAIVVVAGLYTFHRERQMAGVPVKD